MNDASAVKLRQLSQKLSQPGILLEQPINLVVVIVRAKRRFILSKSIFKQRKSGVSRFINPKGWFTTTTSLAILRILYLHDGYSHSDSRNPPPVASRAS
jgi:hypothetical protein